MYYKPGSAIILIGKIFFWLGCVGSLCLAFNFGYPKEYVGYFSIYTERVFHPGIFFAVLLGGIAVSYFYGILLAGFGELVEKTGKIYEHLVPDAAASDEDESTQDDIPELSVDELMNIKSSAVAESNSNSAHTS